MLLCTTKKDLTVSKIDDHDDNFCNACKERDDMDYYDIDFGVMTVRVCQLCADTLMAQLFEYSFNDEEKCW